MLWREAEGVAWGNFLKPTSPTILIQRSLISTPAGILSGFFSLFINSLLQYILVNLARFCDAYQRGLAWISAMV